MLPVLATILVLLETPAIASYLNVIVQGRLPRESVQLISELRKWESYVEEFQPEWSHDFSKKEIKARIGGFLKRTEELLATNEENGELHLLCGLIAFYGFNVDLENARDRADMHFAAARRLFPDDYRPLWLLGMHLVKSTRSVNGMKALLEAEKKQPIPEPQYWEDYATAAYATNMFRHSLKALERVRELTGNKSRLYDLLGKKLREVVMTPKPGAKLEAKFLWQFKKNNGAVRVVSFPFGYSLSAAVREGEDIQYTDFDGRFAAFKVRLTPRTGAGGVIRIPTLQIMTFIPPKQESLEDFTKRLLGGRQKWQKYDLGLGLNEICYRAESDEPYAEDGGASLVMISFEKDCPKVSGLALEEPSASWEESQNEESPRWYRLDAYYTRFKEKLYYQIWLETPRRFFEQSLVEFKNILRTFIVE